MWKLIWNTDLYEPCKNTFKESDTLIDFFQSEKFGFELKENYALTFCFKDVDNDFQAISDYVDLELIEQALEQMKVGDTYYWCEHPLGWDFKIMRESKGWI
tara:strand:+ start:1451 stop:1753 length:303 start_codon:yes stop_codon:yes gene_type:complete